MIAAKAFDPVVGVNIHIIQPPGPVPPLPVPHPFIGILIDPFDFAPIIGSTVDVNGLPRATAGTGGRCIPPHIPIGGVFVKPPANECDVFMGSSTVLADDEPLSFLGMPALSCHCVGMPPIPRLKKKRRVKSLVLPTTFVIAIPMGAPVLVGGPPTISMMALGMRAGMALLGKAFKKLRKLQKASRRMKALSDKIQNAAKKAMNKLGIPPSVQNKVSRTICSVTGHPVDVATGKVFTDSVDLELPGPIPLRWERVWYSCSTYEGPLGFGWHHNYDMALRVDGNAVAVRLADGRGCAFPAVAEGAHAYDPLERLTLRREGVGYALVAYDGLVHHFAPSARDPQLFLLRTIADRVGHAVQLVYDNNDHLRRLIDSAGRTVNLELDARGRIAAVVLPTPDLDLWGSFPVVRYEYDADGNMVAAVDAAGLARRYVYADRLLAHEIDRNGLVFEFRYASYADGYRCVETTGSDGLYKRTLRYDPTLRGTEVTDSLGAVTRYTSNELGLVTQVIDARGHATAFAYDERGNLLSELNASGLTRSVEYDSRGRRTRVTAFDGHAATIAWSEDGREQRVTDRGGAVWTANYDELGRLVRRVEPTGIVEERIYDAALVTLISDSAGRRTRLTYDAQHNVVVSEEADGSRVEWKYDRLGRRIEAKDEGGNILRRTYDLQGRMVRVDEPDGNVRTLAYDGEGNITRVKDLARDVSLAFVGTGRVAAVRQAGRVTEYDYDTEERLIGIRDSLRGSCSLVRDPVGNVVEERSFGSRKTSYVRDEQGRLLEQHWPSGRAARFRYDALGRVIESVHGDRIRKRFEYDAAGG